ncbi:hypothetical protein XELAEV_18001260mg [Xenopus laevis]|uniref:Uncharacterized protein n=1 Tax=Xenopus laevis TaxID=8355 RepID=A0A974BNV9_XENLA|nr:hypothetical protein XELAEV_18001260mg [Xenopus laevis]
MQNSRYPRQRFTDRTLHYNTDINIFLYCENKMLFFSPPAYIAASNIEDIHAISLYEAPKCSWISLKNTVIAFEKA